MVEANGIDEYSNQEQSALWPQAGCAEAGSCWTLDLLQNKNRTMASGIGAVEVDFVIIVIIMHFLRLQISGHCNVPSHDV